MRIQSRLLIVFIIMLVFGLFSGSILAVSNYDLQEVVRGSEMDLVLDIGGAEILFDPDEENIFISEGLKVEKRSDSIYISSPKKDKFLGWLNEDDYYLIVGTARGYENLSISAEGIDLKGRVAAEEIDIKAGGININADIDASSIKINGAGINLEGYVSAHKLHIKGAGINIDIEVEELEDLKIIGAGIDTNIRYLDGWSGTRRISLNGVGGDLNVYLPSANSYNTDGKLDIDTSGIFDTDVHYY